MKCPFCSTFNTRVIDSRLNQTGEITRRRRECLHCGGRLTTYERIEEQMPAVIKKDGRREDFNSRKILDGIQKACQKREVTIAQMEQIVQDLERKIQAMGLKEIPSRALGQVVMKALHRLDKVAYIRFASVYRDFRDVEDFVAELRGSQGELLVLEEEDDATENLKFPFIEDSAPEAPKRL